MPRPQAVGSGPAVTRAPRLQNKKGTSVSYDIKGYSLIPKRPDMTGAHFRTHWSTVHRDHALRIKRIQRYAQSHRIDGQLNGVDLAPYEGIAEYWFAGLAPALVSDDPHYLEHARKDEPNFIDMARLRHLITQFRTVATRRPFDANTKVLLVLRRRVGISVAEFQAAWWDSVEMIDATSLRLSRLAGGACVPVMYDHPDQPDFDAVLEMWWANREQLDAGWREAGRQLLALLRTLTAKDNPQGLIAEELRVRWPHESVAAH